MITGPIKAFELRLRQRGYTWHDVRQCVVRFDGDTVTVDETHAAYPHPRKPGLGDMVSAGLASVGITKERVSRMIGKPCGCEKRQAWLNKAGKRLGIG